MIRALLAGTKTQTRRICKLASLRPSDIEGCDWQRQERNGDWRHYTTAQLIDFHCPYGVPGDRLWVREAWRTSVACDDRPGSKLDGHGWPIWYDADQSVRWTGATTGGPAFTTPGRYRHARFMPRWASRLTLEVTGVRVERVQSIGKEDAIAEGARRFDDIPPSRLFPDSPYQNRWSMEQPEDCGQCLGSPQMAFANLWIKINGAESWDANPFVWVVSFKRVHAVEREVRRQTTP